MDLRKHQEYFNPETINDNIHIIGVGAIGSNIADQLARFGFDNIHLWDIDIVEDKNITNQAYSTFHIGYEKTKAMKAIILDINPECRVTLHEEGYNGEKLDGYVFLAVDSIAIRKLVINSNIGNFDIKAIFDTRMTLTEGQGFAEIDQHYKHLLSTMDFTDEDAKAETPVSACGEVLSIRSTILVITALQVQNFVNYLKEGKLQNTIFYMGKMSKIMAFDSPETK